MPWSKSPQVLMDLFAECLPDEPGIERRKMFGYPVAFVNGNMFAGLFGDGLFARVPPDLWARLECDHGAKPFEPMAGRPMKDYLAIPDAVIADEEALAAALMAAFVETMNLPAKLEKARKP